MFEAGGDGLGRPVAGAGPVEVSEHVGGSAFQGATEGDQVAQRVRDGLAHRGDDLHIDVFRNRSCVRLCRDESRGQGAL
jgi:hypothetical protein